MQTLKRIGLLVVALILGAGIWLWTPDTDYQTTLNKYVGDNAQFITLNNGQRIHFRDTGNLEGPALLMVHGTSDSLLTWEAISPALAKNYRLLSLDLPGHGFSGELNNPSFDELIGAAVEVLAARGLESATWMGNSLGGGIAWRAALHYPEKVERLILLDPSGAPRHNPSKSNIGFKVLKSPVGRFLGRNITPRVLIERSLAGTVVDQGWVSEQLIDRYWELLRLPGNRQSLANLATMPRTNSDWLRIGDIQQPTLIIWGEQDQITPTANAPIFQQAMQKATLKIYPDVGHLPMIEVPQRLVADIRAFIPVE